MTAGSAMVLAAVLAGSSMTGCKAKGPGSVEGNIAQTAKEITVGGKDWVNPTPDDQESQKRGAEHFQHHCEICHGLDGQNTGVPIAGRMSPPVADLASKDVQDYRDGQLKWIIENGIRFSGMPSWKGILTDQEMWYMVRYIRHLPPKGSLGVPKIYEESVHEHESAEGMPEHPAAHDHHAEK
jgi:mono/diheme cytochrome c family protein